MQSLESSWISLWERIECAVQRAGRSSSELTLLAVSKTVSPEKIEEAYHLGQRHFAENYLQEALEKQALLSSRCPDIVWHFIGAIQKRKIPLIAAHFAWVHGIDRSEWIERLQLARPRDKFPLNVCLQVNISGEVSKHGFDPEEALLRDILDSAAGFDRLCWRGLMGMAAPGVSIIEQRDQFHRLLILHQQLKGQMGNHWNVLSMGMSGDLEAAIAEGSTHLRIGTALFGVRP
jgi:PLP dependent protein